LKKETAVKQLKAIVKKSQLDEGTMRSILRNAFLDKLKRKGE